MENLFQTIRAGQDEEISSILSKIIGCKVSRIFLIIPPKSLLFHSPINLRILKEEIDKYGIKLAIITSDETGRALSGKIGIECFCSMPKNIQINNTASSKKKPRILMHRQNRREEIIRSPEEVQIKKSEKIYFSKISAAFAAAGFFTAAVLFFAIFSLPVASVIINSKTDAASKEIEIYIDPDLKEPDLAKKILPGKIVESKKGFSQIFSATGEKNIKNYSRGDIVIFNEWDSSSHSFPKGAELVSESGKVFVSSQTFAVPGFFRLNGKDIAGQVKISAAAKEAGPDFNIQQQKFFISSLANSEKYNKVYGRSYSPMSGGELKKEIFVSRDDIGKASEVLSKEAEKNLEEDLNILNKDEVLVVSDFAENKFSEIKFSAKEGDIARQFSVKAELNKKVLAINKEILNNFLKSLMESDNGSQNISLKENSAEISFLENKNGILKAKAKVSISQPKNLEIEEIKKKILGKSESEAKKMLAGLAAANSISIKFWPFWSSNIPKNEDRVNVFLDINN